MPDAAEVVRSYKEAMASGDFAAARRFVHDDMTFRGPLENFTSPEPYFESLKKLSGIIERIEPHKTFSDGDDVCTLYDMVTKTPAGSALIAEWYRVRRGKIGAIRVVFDARPFAAMFGK
jgi:hypothetical protein